MPDATPAHACPLHNENVATDVPCQRCDCSTCDNRLQTDAAAVAPSKLLPDQQGLFAARDLEAGEWIASFGPMRRVTAADRDSVPYTIPIRETGSNTVVHVTPMGKVSHAHRAHAMNHTCSDTDSNAVITHTGDVSSTTHTVYVRAYKAIDEGQEIFACYGPKQEIGFFDNDECRCHVCGPPLFQQVGMRTVQGYHVENRRRRSLGMASLSDVEDELVGRSEHSLGLTSLSDEEDEAGFGAAVRHSTRGRARRFLSSTQVDDILHGEEAGPG